MNNRTIVLSASLLMSCELSAQRPSSGPGFDVIPSGLNVLPSTYWKTAIQPAVRPYPFIAKRAKIEGRLCFKIQIELSGEVSKAVLLSGAPQLARYSYDHFLATKFKLESTDTAAPFAFYIAVDFDLKKGISFSPLEPVSNQNK